MVSFDEGDVVNGKVVRIDKDEVLVDIGYKAEGVIPSNELSIRKSVNPAEEVELGEEVDALVLTKEDAEGRLILSKKRARFEKAWRRIEVAADSGEPVEGSVIEVVKGGLILDLGVRGFLPASLVDIRRVHNLDEFMGQTLECKVIELNRSRNNVVLSRRAVLEEERKEVREQILGRLEPGQVVEGKISNIVDFGAFVDLDGIDGLIHISELSWSHVNHPSEVVAIGDTVRIKVLDIDRDRQRISLGLKQTQEDPWQRVICDPPSRRRARGHGHQGRRLRCLRRNPARGRGPGPHLRARRPPRREPLRSGRAGRQTERQDPRDRRRPASPVALDQAGRGPEHADAGPQRADRRRAGHRPAATEAPAEGGAEEAAIDLAEDAAVEDQEVESPAIENETVAAEVPEGASAEAAIEDASQAEAAEAATRPAAEAATEEADAAPRPRRPRLRSPRLPPPRPLPMRPPRSSEAPVAESQEGDGDGTEGGEQGEGGEAQEGESAAERPDSPDDTDEAASGDSDSSESE